MRRPSSLTYRGGYSKHDQGKGFRWLSPFFACSPFGFFKRAELDSLSTIDAWILIEIIAFLLLHGLRFAQVFF